MPLPVIADVFRCTLEWSTEGGIAPRNVLHVRAPGSNESDVAGLLAGEMDTNSDAFVFMSGAHSLDSIAVIKLDGSSGTVRPTLGASPTGGAGGQVVPEAAMDVSFATGLRGREHRGRCFVGPGTEDNINNGVISTSTSAVSDAWSAIQLALVLADMELVVASYKLEEANTITTFTARSFVATQRRRLLQTRS